MFLPFAVYLYGYPGIFGARRKMAYYFEMHKKFQAK
jgi:hypothetical protein